MKSMNPCTFSSALQAQIIGNDVCADNSFSLFQAWSNIVAGTFFMYVYRHIIVSCWDNYMQGS